MRRVVPPCYRRGKEAARGVQLGFGDFSRGGLVLEVAGGQRWMSPGRRQSGSWGRGGDAGCRQEEGGAGLGSGRRRGAPGGREEGAGDRGDFGAQPEEGVQGGRRWGSMGLGLG
jgi:hypothetical protein